MFMRIALTLKEEPTKRLESAEVALSSPPIISVTLPPQVKGENEVTKGSWVELRTRSDYSQIASIVKTDSAWGN